MINSDHNLYGALYPYYWHIKLLYCLAHELTSIQGVMIWGFWHDCAKKNFLRHKKIPPKKFVNWRYCCQHQAVSGER